MSVEHLLQPLTEDDPCGMALLHEPEYDAIAAARHEDDPSLPRGVWTSELKRADWPAVVRLCEKALTERSKDLQIAAWLGEAWIALDGLAGGVRAALLMKGLCERFWDRLHPLPRNGDLEFRTAPFDWADHNWSAALALRVPLVDGDGQEAAGVTLAQWQEAAAADNDNLKNKKPAPANAAAPTRQKILAQLADTPAPVLMAQLAALRAWRAALHALFETVALAEPAAAPRMPRLGAVLDQVAELLRHGEAALPPAAAGPADAAEAPHAPLPEAAPAPRPAASPRGDIPCGREDAYARLAVIADYLAHAEPHSPVPFLIRRAIGWGRMPFAELLEELTHNNNEMQTLLLRKPLVRGQDA